MTKGLNEQAEAFRNRELTGESYPVIWVDALYEKARYSGRLVSMAIQIVCGINARGQHEVLAIEPMLEESSVTYGNLFSCLKERGLTGVELVVSDAHRGLNKAIRESFPGASWQRCKVHFMRNILAYVSQRDKAAFAASLKLIWQAGDKKAAQEQVKSLRDRYESKYPKALRFWITAWRTA